MAEVYVQLPDDSANTGKKEDHFQIPNGNVREAVVIASPTANAGAAPVDPTIGLGVNELDGSNITLGAIADVAVTGDNTGTVSAKLRGLSKILADVWSSGNHWLQVSIQNATLAVTQSGTWSVLVGPSIASAETLSSVNSSGTNVTLLASNSSRKGAIMFNDSTQAAYVKLGATATTSSYTYKLFPSQTLELPVPLYQGQIDALWDSANGAMRITETT